MPHPADIPIDRILFPEPVTAGMNYMLIGSLAYLYRATNTPNKPITVTVEGDNYRIHNGRHRTIACIVAGRKTVRAKVRHDG